MNLELVARGRRSVHLLFGCMWKGGCAYTWTEGVIVCRLFCLPLKTTRVACTCGRIFK